MDCRFERLISPEWSSPCFYLEPCFILFTTFLLHYSFIYSFKNYLLILDKGSGGEKETSIFSTYLFIHSLILVCALTGYQTPNFLVYWTAFQPTEPPSQGGAQVSFLFNLKFFSFTLGIQCYVSMRCPA